MEANQQTKRVAFCCPHHGVLKGTPEYFSANFGSKRLVDISAMYCAACGKYYTPFANLLAFKQLRFKGREVAVSQGRVERSVPREVVRVPRFLDINETGIQPSRNTAKNGQTTQRNVTQKASARNIHSRQNQCFIHRKYHVSITNNALFCTECFIESLSQTNTDIFRCVMKIHVSVTFTFNVKVKAPVFCKQGEHVV